MKDDSRLTKALAIGIFVFVWYGVIIGWLVGFMFPAAGWAILLGSVWTWGIIAVATPFGIIVAWWMGKWSPWQRP